MNSQNKNTARAISMDEWIRENEREKATVSARNTAIGIVAGIIFWILGNVSLNLFNNTSIFPAFPFFISTVLMVLGLGAGIMTLIQFYNSRS